MPNQLTAVRKGFRSFSLFPSLDSLNYARIKYKIVRQKEDEIIFILHAIFYYGKNCLHIIWLRYDDIWHDVDPQYLGAVIHHRTWMLIFPSEGSQRKFCSCRPCWNWQGYVSFRGPCFISWAMFYFVVQTYFFVSTFHSCIFDWKVSSDKVVSI